MRWDGMPLPEAAATQIMLLGAFARQTAASTQSDSQGPGEGTLLNYRNYFVQLSSLG